MISGIVFVIVFIIGFAFGLAMPFILERMNIYKKDDLIQPDNKEPSTNMNEIIEEWQNGIRGDR